MDKFCHLLHLMLHVPLRMCIRGLSTSGPGLTTGFIKVDAKIWFGVEAACGLPIFAHSQWVQLFSWHGGVAVVSSQVLAPVMLSLRLGIAPVKLQLLFGCK